MNMTLTRRRMRVSKYNILVNTVGAVVGAKLTDTYFINIKQLLKDSKWRTDREMGRQVCLTVPKNPSSKTT